ncbi:ABC transporter ATP-binding protein [Thioalbus denitrificans]|uniref:Carbohydrate ABC transporter ATP-binding protein (CUT1 family) n=1 Tax=Thioalbus denitrificans TaxID=547122 RepID=A0A369BWE6_9GAMM|nr:ATP-binding cassette domain-containing protein [Thioalbus denitrificans]RCX24737.1 carbohydrate ABC transporter ATP-binding protein (CUT1 family) [Thioalbus denitrificans]
MARVELEGLTRIFPGGGVGLDAIDLTVEEGELLVCVGPSGCGKSTLLRLLAGLDAPTRGTLRFDGTVVNQWPPRRRNVALVFQNYALYPHMTVRGNLAFPLRMRGIGRAAIRARVEATAALLDLTPLLEQRPAQLSGGQRQRVAMGRALVREPALFLMDEPLSNLDARLRVQLRGEIAALQRRTGTTTVYVTHDQVEAMTLGDRVAVLAAGRLRQVAPPREIYDRPADTFVAGFIGSPSMNLLPARLEAGSGGVGIRIGMARLPLPDAVVKQHHSLREQAGRDVIAGLRPESLRPARERPDFRLEVAAVETLGHEQLIYCRPPVGLLDPVRPGQALAEAYLAVRMTGAAVERGQWIGLEVDSTAIHCFDPEGGRRL